MPHGLKIVENNKGGHKIYLKQICVVPAIKYRLKLISGRNKRLHFFLFFTKHKNEINNNLKYKKISYIEINLITCLVQLYRQSKFRINFGWNKLCIVLYI